MVLESFHSHRAMIFGIGFFTRTIHAQCIVSHALIYRRMQKLIANVGPTCGCIAEKMQVMFHRYCRNANSESYVIC